MTSAAHDRTAHQRGPALREEPAVHPADAPDTQALVLLQLLKLEAEARQAPNAPALAHLMANETRALVRARQAFVASRNAGGAVRIVAVSSLAHVDRNAPLIQWAERLVGQLSRNGNRRDKAVIAEFALPAFADAGDSMTASYPFGNMLWVPLWSRQGGPGDGILLAREIPWTEADRRIATRLSETFGHALELLRSRPRHSRLAGRPIRWGAALIVAALAILAAIPVPMTALAPVEIVARDPHVVAMPMEGIVQRILVEPNAAIAQGQVLVRLVDTIARNKLELAGREVLVAAARLEKANSLAFSDARGRHELGIARAELALRLAERDHARDLLARTEIAAAKPGIAVFSDRKEFEGKPLSVGERIMLIADPGAVELKIELGVADSVVLAPGAFVKAFLDSDPLHAIAARLVRIDYQAHLSETNVAAYRIVAEIKGDDQTPPQLGVRGTAQVYGPSVPLALYLFRRPLSALRQWAGL